MGCCAGQKIPMEELFPEELKTLRNNLTNYIGGNTGKGATPYSGNVAAPVNPASNSALNMIMGMMGHGGYAPAQGVPYTGGQQGSPMPWVPYPSTGGSTYGYDTTASTYWDGKSDPYAPIDPRTRGKV